MKKQQRDKRIARAQSGTARASLLGLSDGLTTNVALILGIAGSGAASSFVRIAGFASLIAGACSMAVGEYISTRGQVELLESVLEIEREEFKDDPGEARKSISLLLENDGLSTATAEDAATEIMKNRTKALAMYTREKFKLNEEELGAAWGSAVSSFFTFSCGAAVPLIPWFFVGGISAVYASLGLSALAALAIGGYLGYTTNGRWVRAGVRQLFVLVLAAGATFIIGRIFHAST